MDDLNVSLQTLELFHFELENQKKFIAFQIWKRKIKDKSKISFPSFLEKIQ